MNFTEKLSLTKIGLRMNFIAGGGHLNYYSKSSPPMCRPITTTHKVKN